MARSVLDVMRNELGKRDLPEGSKVYVNSVEFVGTGDELLDMLGYRDAVVDVSVRLPPEQVEIAITIVATD